MIFLSNTTSRIDVFAQATATFPLDWVVGYADITTTTFAPNAVTGTGTGAFTILGSPASSTTRQVKFISINNVDTQANTLGVAHFDGTFTRFIITAVLQPGEALIYSGDGIWAVHDPLGRPYHSSNALDISGQLVAPSHALKIIRSELPSIAGAALTSGTAYFAYMGCTKAPLTVTFVQSNVTAVGSGAQTAEVGIFSTPLPPGGAQSLTKIAATGTVDALTATGMKGNTVSFAQSVGQGVHLWAGMRTAMATTQPSIMGLSSDYGQGAVLTTAASGVLTGAGPFAGAVPANATTLVWNVPDFRMSIL